MANGYKVGETDTRPWGQWWCIDVGSNFAVKRILVKPDQVLSLQLHHHRDEHWIITQGEVEVTLGGTKLRLNANQSVFIPREAKHKIQNVGKTDAIFIEVQTGDKLEETDIERFEDKYGRV